MKKILRIAVFFGILTGFSTCTRGLNDDPNSLYSTTPGSLLTYAEKSLSDYINTPSVNYNNYRLIMQYWQETTYTDESNYDFTTRNISDRVWSTCYVKVLQNLSEAKKNIVGYKPMTNEMATWEGVKKNQLAIIDLLQVYTYQELVNTFGNIPYKQALDFSNAALPEYEDAATIYRDLISRTKADIKNLDVSYKSFDSGELLYQGDVNKWRRFANSLLLKLGITLADYDENLAKSTVQEAIGGGVFRSKEEACEFTYYPSSPNFNPLYENLVVSGRNDYVAAKTIVDYMNSTNDERRTKYFKDNILPYKGGEIGKGSPFSSYTHIGNFAYTATTPGVLLSYTEVAFYLAEAGARWGITDAESGYATAIRASFTEWGLSESQADAYISVRPYDAKNWEKSIGEEAWVALFNQGSSSWTMYRRLDYPKLLAPQSAVVQTVPVRLKYAVRETTTNPTNYAKASAAIGGDLLSTKLFWDKR
ncbi:MAG: SusD/RagB family nutrient-binding outer membrane lipoprotein [Bergeyella sp.]|nr:SusD/RagB family nutrient-binding outer membrane lipoprotein [Bergeyella sp.]